MHELWLGVAAIAQPATALALLAGSLLGIVIGVLPGVGPGVAIAAMLPLTYGVAPLAGIGLLLGVYVGAFYGGAVTSILIRTPGEASSIMTMFDGWPMAQRGEAERALSLAFGSAFVGGVVSALVLAMVAQPVSALTSRFGAAENFGARKERFPTRIRPFESPASCARLTIRRPFPITASPQTSGRGVAQPG